MYIPDFWFGVMSTLFVEFVLVTIVVIISINGKGDE